MAEDIRPTSQTPRAFAELAGAPTIADAFIVSGGTGGRWQLSTTGPAEAYWNDTGAGGRYAIDSGAVAHDAFFKVINSRFRVQ